MSLSDTRVRNTFGRQRKVPALALFLQAWFTACQFPLRERSATLAEQHLTSLMSLWCGDLSQKSSLVGPDRRPCGLFGLQVCSLLFVRVADNLASHSKLHTSSAIVRPIRWHLTSHSLEVNFPKWLTIWHHLLWFFDSILLHGVTFTSTASSQWLHGSAGYGSSVLSCPVQHPYNYWMWSSGSKTVIHPRMGICLSSERSLPFSISFRLFCLRVAIS